MKIETSSRITQTRYREGTLFCLQGLVSDSFDARRIEVRQGVAVFDLEEVSGFTSFGARKFIEMLASLQTDYYCFVRCHAPVMQQFNTVVRFGQVGELVSFYAPYVCHLCGRELERYIDLRRDYEMLDTLVGPELPCPACGVPAELDELPDVYFGYVRSCPCPRPPAAANAIIDRRATPEQTRSCTIRKEIADSVTAIWVAGNLDKAGYCAHLADGLEGHLVLVLAELEQLNESGADGLRRLIAAAPSTCHVARIPVALAGTVLEMLAALPHGSAEVTSMEGPFRCESCQRGMTLELVDQDLERMAEGRYSHACPRCTLPLTARFTLAFAALASQVPITRPPDPILVYLRSSRAFPGGRGEVSGGAELASREAFPSKYRVIKLLGEGGMGQVFLARQLGPEAFERIVVLKRIRRTYLESPEAIQVFTQEARLAARLIHPNIVQVYELARFDGEYFMAMEYVNGIDLAAALSYSRTIGLTWPIGICCRVVSDLCAALEAAHTHRDVTGILQPIIHRDVSPGNILLSVDGEVKLADFGVATALDSSLRTPPGAVKGKLGYTAPEHMADRSGRIDARVDIYAAGVVLYECLTQRRYPISSGSSRRQIPPLANRDDLPPELGDAYVKAVARDPMRRWQSADAFQLVIESVMQGGRYTSRHDLAIFIRALVHARESDGHERSTTGEVDAPSSAEDEVVRRPQEG